MTRELIFKTNSNHILEYGEILGEIVRCKDCKHRQEDVGMGDHRWCYIANGSRRSDDFCSYGERKNNE